MADKRLTRKQARQLVAELRAAGLDADIEIMGDHKPTVFVFEPYNGERCATRLIMYS